MYTLKDNDVISEVMCGNNFKMHENDKEWVS